MLELRPSCEQCDTDLPATEHGAMICSFECTFCVACGTAMNATCPNCGGELVPRPTRSEQRLEAYPASSKRIFKPK